MTVSLGRRTTAWASAAPARDPGPEHPRRLSLTLAGYLARHVLAGIGLALAALAVVALVIDLVELLRRAHDKPRATFAVVLQLAALHLPFLLQKLAPFAVLFGTILSFQRLGRTGELVVTRGTGATPWQILGPALLVALALGGVAVVALNPLAAALVARYERLERAHFSAPADAPIAVGANGLWLRRVDSAGERLVHARRVSEDATELYDVVAFQFDPGGRFVDRTDAARAHLRAGVWELQDALTTAADGQSARTPRLALATELTAAQIRDNFAPPEALSFWDLPGFIRQLKALGVAART